MIATIKIPASATLFCGMLGLLFLGSCGSSNPVISEPESVNIDNFIRGSRMDSLMQFLASDELQGRKSGTQGIEVAAEYISAYFREHGVEPYFNSYRDTLADFQPVSYNIVGVVPGNDPQLKDEFILVGAHYDHIGILDGVQGDPIANGANDNASGTITVMELARYFAASRTHKRSLVFALFSAEEMGLKGSRHLAQKLQAEGKTPSLVLNYEMTGIPLQDKDYLVYMTGYELSDLAERMNQMAEKKVVGFLPQAKEFNLFKRSDNYPFYEVLGIPAHTFSTFDFTNFEHYHKPGDEASLMEGEHMARVVREMIPLVKGLANGKEPIKMN